MPSKSKEELAEVREWWIHDSEIYKGTNGEEITVSGGFVFAAKFAPTLKVNHPVVHVIEKSAYLALEADLKDARKELEQVKAELKLSNQAIILNIDKLTAANERAKGLADALEQLTEWEGQPRLQAYAREALLKYKGEGDNG